ncbi:hypothetical protein NK6_2994 [Bradyrhizobium diazoefficiens]|uniref:Uncharacterized protein n=1 Tax=Bradyrhizobium diazoefficiens TaxID=1355477 RepID=A0A0E4FSZ9_9BRAD|nr:hypothetical protein NK6_2994 [Bradyrhizobium diazoefficiens]
MASGGFLFGYIRFAHFSAGYVVVREECRSA